MIIFEKYSQYVYLIVYVEKIELVAYVTKVFVLVEVLCTQTQLLVVRVDVAFGLLVLDLITELVEVLSVVDIYFTTVPGEGE